MKIANELHMSPYIALLIATLTMHITPAMSASWWYIELNFLECTEIRHSFSMECAKGKLSKPDGQKMRLLRVSAKNDDSTSRQITNLSSKDDDDYYSIETAFFLDADNWIKSAEVSININNTPYDFIQNNNNPFIPNKHMYGTSTANPGPYVVADNTKIAMVAQSLAGTKETSINMINDSDQQKLDISSGLNFINIAIQNNVDFENIEAMYNIKLGLLRQLIDKNFFGDNDINEFTNMIDNNFMTSCYMDDSNNPDYCSKIPSIINRIINPVLNLLESNKDTPWKNNLIDLLYKARKVSYYTAPLNLKNQSDIFTTFSHVGYIKDSMDVAISYLCSGIGSDTYSFGMVLYQAQDNLRIQLSKHLVSNDDFNKYWCPIGSLLKSYVPRINDSDDSIYVKGLKDALDITNSLNLNYDACTCNSERENLSTDILLSKDNAPPLFPLKIAVIKNRIFY